MPQIDLTTPEPAVTSYKPVSLELRYDQDKGQYRVHLTLLDSKGDIETHAWHGTEAQTMIEQLNTADLSTTSLWQRILQRLIDDGVFEGTVN